MGNFSLNDLAIWIFWHEKMVGEFPSLPSILAILLKWRKMCCVNFFFSKFVETKENSHRWFFWLKVSTWLDHFEKKFLRNIFSIFYWKFWKHEKSDFLKYLPLKNEVKLKIVTIGLFFTFFLLNISCYLPKHDFHF